MKIYRYAVRSAIPALVVLLAMHPLIAQQGDAANAEEGYLRAEEAVRIALEQNFGTERARSNQEIARRNYSRGNAGFLPRVSAVASKGWGYQNNEQTNQNGVSREIYGARPSNFNYGFVAQWTIFDGLGMFHAYERLRLQFEGSTLLSQQVVNNLAADVLSVYFRHTLQQQRLELWQNTLELSVQRLRLAKDRYEVGKTSRQEYLAALVDYNADKAALLAQQEALQNTRHELNRLLGQRPSQPVQTVDTLKADSLMLDQLLPQPVTKNPGYRASMLEQAAAERFVEEQRANYWPRLNADLGYNFANQNNPASFFPYNQSWGFTYGFSASWNLFSGFDSRRNVQIARIQAKVAELDRRQLELDLLASQADAAVAFRNQWQLIALEQENLEYARQSAEIALDRYRLGVTTPLELRVAQQNAQQAELRLLNAVYELKLSEIELMRISGQLVSGF